MRVTRNLPRVGIGYSEMAKKKKKKKSPPLTGSKGKKGKSENAKLLERIMKGK
jgi:hypothetical protein